MTGVPRVWGASAAEHAAAYPCDELLDPPVATLTRAVDVGAPASATFRWVCQLRVAPYSYDWIDNWGRQSPRELTPGLDELAVGQQFVEVFSITSFERDRHITGRGLATPEKLFGPLATSYAVEERGASSSRLIVRLLVGQESTFDRVRGAVLSWGDLVMMRKQVLTLRDLAERGG